MRSAGNKKIVYQTGDFFVGKRNRHKGLNHYNAFKAQENQRFTAIFTPILPLLNVNALAVISVKPTTIHSKKICRRKKHKKDRPTGRSHCNKIRIYFPLIKACSSSERRIVPSFSSFTGTFSQIFLLKSTFEESPLSLDFAKVL